MNAWRDGSVAQGEQSKSIKGGWARWHADSLRPQRMASPSKKAVAFLLFKFTPKLALFTAATAALQIDYIGDGRRLNFAIFRSWITGLSALLYLGFTLV